jgi:hypothetical protein
MSLQQTSFLRNVSDVDLVSLVLSLRMLSKVPSGALPSAADIEMARQYEKFVLDISFFLMNAPYLSKRVQGWAILNHLITRISSSLKGHLSKTDDPTLILQPSDIKDRISEEELFANCLSLDQIHIEIVKLFGPVLKFLVDNDLLDKKNLKQVCDAFNQTSSNTLVSSEISGLIKSTFCEKNLKIVCPNLPLSLKTTARNNCFFTCRWL